MTPRSIASKALGALAITCLLATWSGCLFTNGVDPNNSTTPTPDMGSADMTAPSDMSCEPPSAEEACEQMSAQCGEFDIQVCGDVYSVTCPCAQGETCTAEGTCACNTVNEPPLTCATSTSGGGCGQLTYDSGCGVLAVQDCGSCPPTLVCSNNQCVEDGGSCSPNTCVMQGITCGPLAQCGEEFTCGECSGTDICEAGECVPQGCPGGEPIMSPEEICGMEEASANASCQDIYTTRCGENEIVSCQESTCDGCARSDRCSSVIVQNPGSPLDQFGRAILIRKNTLVVAAPNAHSSAGAVYLYRIRPDGTVTQTPDVVTGNQLGMVGAGATLAALGEWLIIGAPEQGKVAVVGVKWEDTDQPTFDTNTFGDALLSSNNGNRTGSFGSALSTWSDGSTHLIAVGQPVFNDGLRNTGSAYVYSIAQNRSPKDWGFEHIIPSNRVAEATTRRFGDSLAFGVIDTADVTPTLFIGAPTSSYTAMLDRSGEVHAYTYSEKTGDGKWYEEDILAAPAGQMGFGKKMTWAKSHLITASPAEGGASDKLHKVTQTNGRFSASPVANFASAGFFGPALESVGESIFLSIADKGGESARVLVGRAAQGVEWTLSPASAGDESSFGASISMNADFVAVGAPDSNVNAPARGAVYLFPTPPQP